MLTDSDVFSKDWFSSTENGGQPWWTSQGLNNITSSILVLRPYYYNIGGQYIKYLWSSLWVDQWVDHTAGDQYKSTMTCCVFAHFVFSNNFKQFEAFMPHQGAASTGWLVLTACSHSTLRLIGSFSLFSRELYLVDSHKVTPWLWSLRRASTNIWRLLFQKEFFRESIIIYIYIYIFTTCTPIGLTCIWSGSNYYQIKSDWQI